MNTGLVWTVTLWPASARISLQFRPSNLYAANQSFAGKEEKERKPRAIEQRDKKSKLEEDGQSRITTRCPLHEYSGACTRACTAGHSAKSVLRYFVFYLSGLGGELGDDRRLELGPRSVLHGLLVEARLSLGADANKNNKTAPTNAHFLVKKNDARNQANTFSTRMSIRWTACSLVFEGDAWKLFMEG